MNEKHSLKQDAKKKWSIRESKVNLAALLNDPRKVRRDFDLFTKTWGETFRELPPGSTIRRSKWVPNVQRGHFADYLSRTSDRLLRHDSQLLKDSQRSEKTDSFSEVSHFLRNDSNVIKTAVTAQQERDAVMKTRLALDTLPRTFLRSDFDMGNPQIFASVLNVNTSTDAQRVYSSDGRNGEINSSRMLQDKLSHYLDRVEMAIVRQISLQSDAFFKAMESHEELHDYLNKTMTSVQNLITKLKQVKQNVADNSLQVINLRRTHINSINLLNRLQMMVTVHQTQPTIQLLLSTSEYAGSLDLIKTTQEVLRQELAGLQCFRHLSCQLTEMERVIGQMMRQEMDECLRDEIHRSVTEGPSCRDPHRLAAVMLGLLRQGQFEFLQEFREEIEIAVKTIIKNTVSDAVEVPDQEKNETLASKMRMLEFSDWIDLLNQLFDNLLILLRRIRSILDLLENVAQDSVARGDICRLRRIKKIDRLISRKKSRLKSTVGNGGEISAASSGNENSNPFIDSPSSSESNEENSNPFLNGSSEKNPFLQDSPQHHKMPNSNPFLEDISYQNDAGGDHLMEGLASYEDELINSAADSFIPHDGSSETPPEQISQSVGEEVHSNDTSQKVDEELLTEVVSSEECDGFLFALKDMLQWTLDFQQDRCVKVLIAKGKDSSLDKLSSSDFLKLAKSIERFTSEAENVSRKTASENSDKLRGLNSSLRGALQTQAGRFVTRFHDERRNKLSLILDNEVWKQAEVPVELSLLLKQLVMGRISSDSNDKKFPFINGDARDRPKALEFLDLDGERYVVSSDAAARSQVGNIARLLENKRDAPLYLQLRCADDLPTSTPDLVHRLRDLLTLFNSRTCQLVLGAGALQLVGLKTITTKNLALASRCLQLVLHCVPAVKRHFEIKLLQLNQSNDDKSSNKYLGVLRHFDHVVKDYQDHVNEVENKLTAIVMSVIERQLTRWEVKAPVPSPAFRNICKQITKFYDTVTFLLPQDQICRILSLLNNELKTELRLLLHRYNVRNDGGPQHGLVTSDLTFYEANIKVHRRLV